MQRKVVHFIMFVLLMASLTQVARADSQQASSPSFELQLQENGDPAADKPSPAGSAPSHALPPGYVDIYHGAMPPERSRPVATARDDIYLQWSMALLALCGLLAVVLLILLWRKQPKSSQHPVAHRKTGIEAPPLTKIAPSIPAMTAPAIQEEPTITEEVTTADSTPEPEPGIEPEPPVVHQPEPVAAPDQEDLIDMDTNEIAWEQPATIEPVHTAQPADEDPLFFVSEMPENSLADELEGDLPSELSQELTLPQDEEGPSVADILSEAFYAYMYGDPYEACQLLEKAYNINPGEHNTLILGMMMLKNGPLMELTQLLRKGLGYIKTHHPKKMSGLVKYGKMFAPKLENWDAFDTGEELPSDFSVFLVNEDHPAESHTKKPQDANTDKPNSQH